ncbi:MAG: DUF5989 family protein [Pirellulaceae bacterium]|nr:DUF5989 family protein [Pirellulaceae bacterium]
MNGKKVDEVESALEQTKQKSVGSSSFEQLSEHRDEGIVREFFDFLKTNKKWWLTPIILVLLLVGALIVVTSSGAAPFLYTFW